MKFTRKANNLKEAVKLIEHAKALGSPDHHIRAHGYWVDIHEDPWNTPREIIINGAGRAIDKYGSGTRAELIPGEDSSLEVEIYF